MRRCKCDAPLSDYARRCEACEYERPTPLQAGGVMPRRVSKQPSVIPGTFEISEALREAERINWALPALAVLICGVLTLVALGFASDAPVAGGW